MSVAVSTEMPAPVASEAEPFYLDGGNTPIATVAGTHSLIPISMKS
jgi:hypothetical protein